jgi:hypothetical protein
MNLANLYDNSAHSDTVPKKPAEQKPAQQKPPPDSMDAALAAKSDDAARPPRPVPKRKGNYFPRDAAEAAQVAKYTGRTR